MSEQPSIALAALRENCTWLEDLARTLVRDAARADEAVQATWMACLRHPPEQGVPLRPWLARVMQNAVKLAHRSAMHRAAREVAAAEVAPLTAPSPEHLLEKLEAQQLLLDHVVALDEPFRSAVVLRYFDGLSAAEIARRQGVPAGTVRWRLKTGLDRLRGELSESDPLRPYGCLALVPLALPRSRWGTLRELTLAAKSTTALVAVAVGLLLVAGLAAWLGGHRAHALLQSPPEAHEQLAPTAIEEGNGRAAHELSPTSPSQPQSPRHDASAPVVPPRARTEADPNARFGALEGQILSWGTARPIGGAQVVFSIAGKTVSVSTRTDGGFVFEPWEAGPHELVAVHAEGFLPYAPEWSHSPISFWARPGQRVRDVTLYLSRAIDYRGLVLAPDGRPVSGAEVRRLDVSGSSQALMPIAERFVTDANGSFTFHAPDSAAFEATHPDYAPGRGTLSFSAQVSHQMTIRLGDRTSSASSLRLTGRVLDPSRQAITGAVVRATPIASGGRASGDQGGDISTVTDPEGRFSLERLAAGDYRLDARHPDWASSEGMKVAAGARDVELALLAGASIRGTVVDSEGRPVPVFTLVVGRARGALEVAPAAWRSVVDSRGEFQVGNLEAGSYSVLISAQGFAPADPLRVEVPVPPALAEPALVRLLLGATLRGRVISAGDGRSLGNARVTLQRDQGIGPSALPLAASTVTVADGAFELVGLPEGDSSVLVAASGHHGRIIGGLRARQGDVLGPLTFDLTPTKEGEDPTLELAGIGAVLKATGDFLQVERVISGGGAQEQGLAPGDLLVSVDGTPVSALGFDRALQKIRGAEGTTVRLVLRKAGAAEPVALSVPRRRLQLR
ncbi:MAG: sigma-70 family RNA polymerase sigma factor [Deltaproteobacteria bacterium]|nr:sigma-70 family RNA polymerase sigma factor [Deltaproteobacteria bacterium]